MAKFLIQSIIAQEVKKKLFSEVVPENDDFDSIDPKQYSQLGNPIYSNLEFEPKVYKWDENEFNFDGIRIDTVLMTVNRTKNIVKTQIQGRNGTVKEYISNGDWSISIDGEIISPEPKVYPAEAVRRLKELEDVPLPLEITSEFLNNFDIGLVVVENVSFPQKAGFRNTQPFSMSLVSDEPIELQIDAEL